MYFDKTYLALKFKYSIQIVCMGSQFSELYMYLIEQNVQCVASIQSGQIL